MPSRPITIRPEEEDKYPVVHDLVRHASSRAGEARPVFVLCSENPEA